MARQRTASTSSVTTVTLQTPDHPLLQKHPPQTLVLRLNRKKNVSWKEGTVDNEFMQKKSSKKCCIFHKQKPFDGDDSGDEHDHVHDDHRSQS
ncbi:type 1 phosphatases regulator YPI2 [Tripterygium wilfordii]|uniref:Type 1 phosphatases regulator YPI2 n=1 Tax=Tripterygium wilfordii TaxID=458696 RepID=A0A7J7CBN7_TRIWF|nr:protein phosphatase 1 regulatory subunit INH3-like [Tripterygium wilfordii]KAF5731548.1 type 1 phosphatases regulator YPI2 [Tripterygium wilfordii]